LARNLASFSHDFFRKEIKNLSDIQKNDKMDRILILIKYVRDKDFFKNYYSQNLILRIIENSI
jgi:hypothetical protein